MTIAQIFNLCRLQNVRLFVQGGTLMATPRKNVSSDIKYGLTIQKQHVLHLPTTMINGCEYFVVNFWGGTQVFSPPTTTECLIYELDRRGWPKMEWGGPGEQDWREAIAFMDEGELFDALEGLPPCSR